MYMAWSYHGVLLCGEKIEVVFTYLSFKLQLPHHKQPYFICNSGFLLKLSIVFLITIVLSFCVFLLYGCFPKIRFSFAYISRRKPPRA